VGRCALTVARSRSFRGAPRATKIADYRYCLRWRDPDSNRGHHDFRDSTYAAPACERPANKATGVEAGAAEQLAEAPLAPLLQAVRRRHRTEVVGEHWLVVDQVAAPRTPRRHVRRERVQQPRRPPAPGLGRIDEERPLAEVAPPQLAQLRGTQTRIFRRRPQLGQQGTNRCLFVERKLTILATSDLRREERRTWLANGAAVSRALVQMRLSRLGRTLGGHEQCSDCCGRGVGGCGRLGLARGRPWAHRRAGQSPRR
jgi:hypothetical protein